MLHFRSALLPEGWASDVVVAIKDGMIASVATGQPSHGTNSHFIGLPGMANVHSHAFQRAMAGLAERSAGTVDDFWSWRETMYALAERINPDSLAIIAAMAQVEMLESGFTRVGEFHYLHHGPDGRRYDNPAAMSEAILAASARTGIGLTHLPVFYANAGFGGTAPEPRQRRFASDIESFARLLDDCRALARTHSDAIVGVAPHSLRAVARDDLLAVAALAGEAPIHIHVAEQVTEVEACLAALGARPVRWLLDNAPVDDRWCLIHATHVDASEIESIVAAQAVVGLCPVTEANLGDGLFPAKDFVERQGRFGVGSDSNVAIEAMQELRLLEYGQRLVHRSRNVLRPGGHASVGRCLYEGAVVGGSQALGVKSGIRPGASADLLSLDGGHVAFAGRDCDTALDSLVFAAGSGAVANVWRRGRLVVQDGRHVMRDEIAGEFGALMRNLLA